jgi:hypothetical protein
MTDLEHDLRESLRRHHPPVGFAERVSARIRQAESRPEAYRTTGQGGRWVAVAAMVIILAGAFVLHRDQQRRANEAAKEQLLFALRVTGIHVRYLQLRLSEVEQKTISLPPERSE